MTVDEWLRWSDRQLPSVESGAPDSKIILCYLLGIDLASLIANSDRQLSGKEEKEFKSLVLMRMRGAPIAYITHSREFWSLDLKVDDRVLIPRHETELLVERSLSALAGIDKPRILEPGTGSGAVALALASELPGAEIVATDMNESPLEVAKSNQQNLGLKNIQWIKSNWFDRIEEGRFDLICSNPPYIATDDIHLTQGDLRFEPTSALVAKNQGFASLSEIVDAAPGFLECQGWLILEHGCRQASQVREKMIDRGFSRVVTHKDLDGNDRVTEGCWSNDVETRQAVDS